MHLHVLYYLGALLGFVFGIIVLTEPLAVLLSGMFTAIAIVVAAIIQRKKRDDDG